MTESLVVADLVRGMQRLDDLAASGVKIAIDDFGTGYSSLAYVKLLPLSDLKIDKSFVMHMAEDGNDDVIVRSTIELGHSLGLAVIAEGVESEEVMGALAEAGCDSPSATT